VNESLPWAPFEDRKRARDEKRDAVLRMAATMFLKGGYHRTPLSQIAERLNITKPALYNYFSSKEEILRELFRLGDERYEEGFGKTEREGGTGLETLQAMIRAYAHAMTTDVGKCFARIDDRDLSEEAQIEVRRSKRRYDRALRKQIKRGIEDGSITPCDAQLAAFALAGALNGIADWFEPTGRLSPQTVANEFATRLTEGLATSVRQHKKS
jgi:AcrR family transcriptional regulator